MRLHPTSNILVVNMWNTSLLINFLLFFYLFSSVKSWVWKCDNVKGFCKRTNNRNGNFYPSIEVCRLVCGLHGALWPKPTILTKLSEELIQFDYRNITIRINKQWENTYFLEANSKLFLHHKVTKTKNCPARNKLNVEISTDSDDLSLTWSTDESYELTVHTEGTMINVKITAPTAFGARHGLETLSQLIARSQYPESDTTCLVMNKIAKIKDKPVYPHRGLLLDSSRNFIPIPDIKKHIDGMAASKLNVLHWHVTDSQSFPLESLRVPKLTEYGAYSKNHIYHTKDVADLLQYAKIRGIRIIIEIDAPSHAGNGWQWGPEEGLGNLTVCYQEKLWRDYCIQPPCGQLNPINPFVYDVLRDLYADIMDLLPQGEVFHMGGDEVFIPCWNSTPEIVRHLKGRNLSSMNPFLDLWGDFQNRAKKTFDSVVGNQNTPLILWTSQLTDVLVIGKYLPRDRYVIQTWVPASDPTPSNLLALGYRIIVSTKDAWYLDHGFWGNTQYHDWMKVYNNRIPSEALGGEVCMWGEYVDGNSVDTRIWPRAAAAAERLWTDPAVPAVVSTSVRFYRHRQRLIERGIRAAAVIPGWCYQNEGECI